MEIIDKQGMTELADEDKLSITEMLLFEIALSLETLVELQNGK